MKKKSENLCEDFCRQNKNGAKIVVEVKEIEVIKKIRKTIKIR